MTQKTKKRIWTYVGFIGGTLLVGGISAIASMKGMREFQALKQPPLSPPAWLFPVAWTVLYVLMGIAAARVFIANTPETRPALITWGAQLLANALWSPLFFTLKLRLAAFVLLVILIILVVRTIARFKRIDAPAGNLMIPYLIWLLFAAYLNMGVYLLNR